MLKNIKCDNCEGIIQKIYICDTCGLEQNIPHISVADVTNPFCMQELNKHFCSEKCHMEDSISEYNKRNKQKDILYGMEEDANIVELEDRLINVKAPKNEWITEGIEPNRLCRILTEIICVIMFLAILALFVQSKL